MVLVLVVLVRKIVVDLSPVEVGFGVLWKMLRLLSVVLGVVVVGSGYERSQSQAPSLLSRDLHVIAAVADCARTFFRRHLLEGALQSMNIHA